MSAIADLPLFAANLRRLAGVRSSIARRGAQGITNQIRIDTSSGLDCYSKPFAPLAVSTIRRGRRPPPMVATGASLDATAAKPLSGAGIAIVLGGAYEHHLRKTASRPARQVVPVRAGLPASWNQRLARASQQEIQKVMA